MSAAKIRAGGAFLEILVNDKKLQAGLKRAESAVKSSMKKMSAATAKAGAMMDRLAASINRTAASAVRLDLMGRSMRGFANSLSAAASGMRSSGFQLLFAGGMGMAGIGSVVKDLAEFERKLALTRGTLGGMDAKVFGSMRKDILDVAKVTEFTATQLADVTHELAKAGVGLKAITSAGKLDSLLKGFVGFGVSTGIDDLGQLTEMAVQFTSMFGSLSGDARDADENVARLNRTMNIMVATANNSAQSVEDLFESLKMAGPMAKQIGMTQEELAGMSAVLADAGIKGTLAGTSLRRIFTNMVDRTKIDQFNAAITKIGKTAIEVEDKFGNLKSPIEVLKQIMEATKDMGSAERISLMANLFDVRGMQQALTLMADMEKVEDKINKIREQRTAATDKAAEAQRSLFGAVTQVKSAFDVLMKAFGTALKASGLDVILRSVAVALNELSNEKNAALLKKIAQVFVVVASVATAVGIALTAVGGAAALVLSAFTALLPIIMAVGVHLLFIDTLMSKGGGMRAFADGIATGLKKGIKFIQKFMTQMNMFLVALETSKSVLAALVTGPLLAMKAVGVAINGVFSVLLSTIKAVSSIVKTVAALITGSVLGLANMFKAAMAPLNILGTMIMSYFKVVTSLLQSMMTVVIQVSSAVAKGVIGFLKMEAIIGVIKSLLAGVSEALTQITKRIGESMKVLGPLVGAIQLLFKAGNVDQIGAVLMDMFRHIGDTLYHIIRESLLAIRDEFYNIFGELIELVKLLGGQFNKAMDGDSFEKMMNRVGRTAGSYMVSEGRKMEESGSVWNTATRYLSGRGDFLDAWDPSLGGVKRGAGQAMQGFGRVFENVLPKMGRAIDMMMGGNFLDKILGGLLLIVSTLELGFGLLLSALTGMTGIQTDALIKFMGRGSNMAFDAAKQAAAASKEKADDERAKRAADKEAREKAKDQRDKEAAEKAERARAKAQVMSWASWATRTAEDYWRKANEWVNDTMGTVGADRMGMFSSQGKKDVALAGIFAQMEEVNVGIANKVKGLLGGALSSRAVGGFGQAGMAMAGTRQASIDIMMHEELMEQTKQLRDLNEKYKNTEKLKVVKK